MWGARLRNRSGSRDTHKSAGSTTCVSAEIIFNFTDASTTMSPLPGAVGSGRGSVDPDPLPLLTFAGEYAGAGVVAMNSIRQDVVELEAVQEIDVGLVQDQSA